MKLLEHLSPREPYGTGSLHSHASTSNDSPTHDDNGSVSEYYHHHDAYNNHHSATNSPQLSEHNQSDADFDDNDDDNDVYVGYDY